MTDEQKKAPVRKQGTRVLNMIYIAMFAVLIAVCSWVSLPIGSVPFTLQTFGVFCAVGMLGGKRGTLAVLVYLLLGMIGVPVFSNFGGGLGILLGTTGGYIIGFLGSALVYWLITKLLGQRLWSMLLGMGLGLLVCYFFGTAWFMVVYTGTKGAVSLAAALGWCVLPFVLPDVIKIAAAVALTKAVKRRVRIFD